MIVVTGGAGFIGSNIVHALNRRGSSDILVVDDLTDGTKFTNVATADISDYEDYDRFLGLVERNALGDKVEAIFHQGACSDTTEWNGRYVMEVNYRYSKLLFDYATSRHIPFIYASSASVYGIGTKFSESGGNEAPINMYGYSKTQFDRYAGKRMPAIKSPVVGLRYFNVYGPREQHKGRMASVAWHFYQQLHESGKCQLFAGTDGYADGEQRRDFVYVDDVVDVNLWFLEHGGHSGIYNVGTGRSQSFNDVAGALISFYGGQIEYIPFPEDLKGRYQSFTEADLTLLRSTGCDVSFRSVEDGVKAYISALK